jgi:hypothetical protein
MDYHGHFTASVTITKKIMWKRFLEKRRAQTVMGHKLREPRPTWLAGFWAIVYFGLPFLLITMLIDLAIAWLSGTCVGLWCYL